MSAMVDLSDNVDNRELDVPNNFGKYRPFASLGSGGMAEVYLAVSRGPRGVNKLVVVKRLRPNLVAEAGDFAKMFVDEARLATRFNHTNIVDTYEIGEQEDGGLFIAMEYLEGQSLEKLMRICLRTKSPLKPSLALRIVIDALVGLQYAHDVRDYDGTPLGVVHRDISPHNIFVTYDGVVKLVDFGIAKTRVNSTHTEAGTFKGKVGYMAPEQVVSEFDHRADVFAVGVVLWELLACRRLFAGDAVQVMHHLLQGDIPRLSTVIEIDPELDAIVEKALKRRVEDRYQTAEEMRLDLEAYERRHAAAPNGALGKVMGEAFKEVRAEVARRIDAQMKVLDAEGLPPQGALPSLRVTGTSLQDLGSGPSSGRIRAPDSSQAFLVNSTTYVPVATPHNRAKSLSLAGALVGLTALVIWLVIQRPHATASAPANAPAQPPSVAAGPAVKPTTLVILRSEPPGATVEWQGRVGSTPYTLEMPSGPQRIHMSHDGFEPADLDIDVPEGSSAPLSVPVTKLIAAPPAAVSHPSAQVLNAHPIHRNGARAVVPSPPAPSAPSATAPKPVEQPSAVSSESATAQKPATRTNLRVLEDVSRKPSIGVLP